MKEIHIDIDAEGRITIEAHGYTGNSCRTATAALEKALGQVATRKSKHEGLSQATIRQQRLRREQ